VDISTGELYHTQQRCGEVPRCFSHLRYLCLLGLKVGAQYIYAILGPQGLRVLTPMVVYIELLAAPLAFVASLLGNTSMLSFSVGLICQLHIGISFSIRNAVLLSYIACCAWCFFLPIGWKDAALARRRPTTARNRLGLLLSTILVGGIAAGNIWFETIGTDCSTGSLRKIWSTLLQNRWNVFIGAEEYVTWYDNPSFTA